ILSRDSRPPYGRLRSPGSSWSPKLAGSCAAVEGRDRPGEADARPVKTAAQVQESIRGRPSIADRWAGGQAEYILRTGALIAPVTCRGPFGRMKAVSCRGPTAAAPAISARPANYSEFTPAKS